MILPAEKTETASRAQRTTLAVGVPEQGRQADLPWLDLLKAVALLWIFLNHVTERVFGPPYIANPNIQWPDLFTRLLQLRPMTGHGLPDVFANALRYIGWSGDQGVQLFLIASGFGLTWGFLRKYGSRPLPLGDFYRRRVTRILPLWVAAHILVVGISFLSLMPQPDPIRFALSLLGIRITSGMLYSISAAWWYIGLLLQLYLVYPLIWESLRKKGPLWTFLVLGGISLIIRGIGLLVFKEYLDAWSRGALFVTRLPEFLLGVVVASTLHSSAERTDHWLRRGRTTALAVLVYAVGTVLSITLVGMAVAPFLLGAGAFVILYRPLRSLDLGKGPVSIAGRWIGRHSYSLFLVHDIALSIVLPLAAGKNSISMVVAVFAAGLVTIGLALLLEAGVDRVSALVQRVGLRRAVLILVGALVIVGLMLLGAENVVRHADPQEVLGWGERASLEPHPVFGWRLKPHSETRLRWQSYDYVMQANALGFPGPDVPVMQAPATLRVLTVGDAFTSAEGVNTEESWPRLLEKSLAGSSAGQSVQVLNFAITGYGPNQYQAVVDSFAPLYKPRMILVEMFVNDFEDVLTSNDVFRRSIGFHRSSQEAPSSYMKLLHLQAFLKNKLVAPILADLSSMPSPPDGYFLGNYKYFEKARAEQMKQGQEAALSCLQSMKATADRIHAQMAILLVPAPIQVAPPAVLDYAPRHVDLADTSLYDLEMPQRLTREIADSLAVPWFDLRLPLRTMGAQTSYQPGNMHWTREGHRIVADYVAQTVVPLLLRKEENP